VHSLCAHTAFTRLAMASQGQPSNLLTGGMGIGNNGMGKGMAGKMASQRRRSNLLRGSVGMGVNGMGKGKAGKMASRGQRPNLLRGGKGMGKGKAGEGKASSSEDESMDELWARWDFREAPYNSGYWERPCDDEGEESEEDGEDGDEEGECSDDEDEECSDVEGEHVSSRPPLCPSSVAAAATSTSTTTSTCAPQCGRGASGRVAGRGRVRVARERRYPWIVGASRPGDRGRISKESLRIESAIVMAA